MSRCIRVRDSGYSAKAERPAVRPRSDDTRRHVGAVFGRRPEISCRISANNRREIATSENWNVTWRPCRTTLRGAPCRVPQLHSTSLAQETVWRAIEEFARPQSNAHSSAASAVVFEAIRSLIDFARDREAKTARGGRNTSGDHGQKKSILDGGDPTLVRPEAPQKPTHLHHTNSLDDHNVPQ